MVTVGELAIGVALFWVILILVANRIDLQRYNLFVSSLFFLYMPEIITNTLKKLSEKKLFWNRIAYFAIYPSIILLIGLPVFLSLNLVRGMFFEVIPLFILDVTNVLRIENFLLTLPILAFFLSFHMFVKAIYGLIDGREIKRSGFLVVGVILTFFSQLKGTNSKKYKIKFLSVIVIFHLIIVLLALPLGSGLQGLYQNQYQEPQGALVTSIVPNTPGYDSNIEVGNVIISIQIPSNQFNDQSFSIYSSKTLERTLRQIPAGVEMLISIYNIDTNSTIRYTITGLSPIAEEDQGSYLGIFTIDFKPPKDNSFLPLMLPFWTELFFEWLFNLSFLFLIASVLPLPSTRGLELFELVNEAMNFGITAKHVKFVSYFSLIILALNILYLVA